MEIKYNISGAKELEDALKKLPDIAAKKVAQGAMRAGANVFKKAAQENVPVESGDLKKAIVVRQDKIGQSTVNYSVGITGKPRFYAHLVEFGTAPHIIRPDKQKALSNGRFFVEEIHHPGARAHPFLRPAFDNNQEAVLAKIGKALGSGIEREAVKFVHGTKKKRR